MSNIHGLHSSRKSDSDSEDDENNRFVGGIGERGGGRYEPFSRDPFTKG